MAITRQLNASYDTKAIGDYTGPTRPATINPEHHRAAGGRDCRRPIPIRRTAGPAPSQPT
jgi:hypothetical protein